MLCFKTANPSFLDTNLFNKTIFFRKKELPLVIIDFSNKQKILKSYYDNFC